MTTKSITLWKRALKVTSDEAGTTVTSHSLPGYVTGPYESQEVSVGDEALTYIPSLQSLCIKQLIPFPDQVYTAGNFQIPYKPPQSPGDYDILQELIPGYSYAAQTRDQSFLKYVDPRLWAILVQLYVSLPEVFRTYNIPLSDVHVPLLQQIPSTPRFALVTVLTLYGCDNIHDDTIVELRDLHGLAALNVGGTALSSWGVTRLSKLLRSVESRDYDSGRRLLGPWELRILSLRNCMNVDDDVYKGLRPFPLLSVVDLRGTRCSPTSYRSSGFRPSEERKLYHPTPLHASLMHLADLSIPSSNSAIPPQSDTLTFYPHPQPYYLHISSLNHISAPARHIPSPSIGIMDNYRDRPTHQGQREAFSYRTTGMEDRVWTAPITPSGRRTTDDLNAIADLEARRHGSAASALQFYMTYASRSAEIPEFKDLPSACAGRNVAKPDVRPLTGLALFRPPRPWSDLLAIADGQSATNTSRKKTSLPAKRPRMEIDDALMGVTDAKRRGHAQKAIKAVWGMVERRKSAPEPTSKPKIGVEVSSNPFLRRHTSTSTPAMQGFLDEGLVQSLRRDEEAPTPVSATTKVNVSISDRVLEIPEKSTFQVPPPTTKPLRPISTLSVPSRPAETPKTKMKFKSSSNTKLSRSIENARQMTLTEFTSGGGAAKTSNATSRNATVRGSVGAVVGSSAGSAKSSSTPGAGHVGISAKAKDTGRSVHTSKRQMEDVFGGVVKKGSTR